MATASEDLDPQEVDARFAALVADLPDPEVPRRPAKLYGPRDWPVTDEVAALEEAETHFVPPTPGPQLRRFASGVLGWFRRSQQSRDDDGAVV